MPLSSRARGRVPRSRSDAATEAAMTLWYSLGTTEWASILSMSTSCLACFNGCTSLTNLKARASDWLRFSGLYIVTEGRSGPRASLAAVRLSISQLREHKDNYGEH